MKQVFSCARCGSRSVQVMAWVLPNTGDVLEYISENGSEQYYAWCPDCDGFTDYVITEGAS